MSRSSEAHMGRVMVVGVMPHFAVERLPTNQEVDAFGRLLLARLFDAGVQPGDEYYVLVTPNHGEWNVTTRDLTEQGEATCP